MGREERFMIFKEVKLKSIEHRVFTLSPKRRKDERYDAKASSHHKGR